MARCKILKRKKNMLEGVVTFPELWDSLSKGNSAGAAKVRARAIQSTQAVARLGVTSLFLYNKHSSVCCLLGWGARKESGQAKKWKKDGESRELFPGRSGVSGVWRGNLLWIAAWCRGRRGLSGFCKDLLHFRLGLPLGDVTGWSSGTRRLDEWQPSLLFNSFVMWRGTVVRQVPSVHSQRGSRCLHECLLPACLPLDRSLPAFLPSLRSWMAWDMCNQDSVWSDLEVRGCVAAWAARGVQAVGGGRRARQGTGRPRRHTLQTSPNLILTPVSLLF